MKSGTKEIFEDSGNFDTRKVLNRSGKTISIDTMNEIETKGITSEQLDDLKIPVFKYKTQITLHGHFPEIQNERLAGYKSLILNGNESLGVKYIAVDREKKNRIFKRLHRFGYYVQSNSTEYLAYQSKTFTKKEDAIEQIKIFKEMKAKIDISLFFGNVQVFGMAGMWGSYHVYLILNIGAIYEKNVTLLIENVTGKTIVEVDSLIEAEERKEAEEAKLREIQYQKEREAEEKRLSEFQANVKEVLKNNGFVYQKDIKEGMFIAIQSYSCEVKLYNLNGKLYYDRFKDINEALNQFNTRKTLSSASITKKRGRIYSGFVKK